MKCFRMLLVAVGCLLLCQVAAGAEEHPVLKLWPRGLPAGSVQLSQQRIAELQERSTPEHLTVVTDPSLTLYLVPKDQANGCAVVVCPGGGYNILAWPKEGTEIAQWLNSFGVSAVVLKYRVPRRDPKRPHWEPLQDAQRAIRTVRANAEKWGVDPSRVGILGFSAGGHLTIMAGTHWNEKTYEPADDIDRLSCRPDFMIPIYAAYLGDKYDDVKTPTLGPLVRVTPETPPTFMAVTFDDQMRGAQAAMLLVELKKAGVPAELHVFSKGGHGYGLRPSPNPVARAWPKLCELWMRSMGLLDRGKVAKSP